MRTLKAEATESPFPVVIIESEDAHMKVLIIGNPDRYERYRPEDMPLAHCAERVFCPRGSTSETLLAAAADADFIAADPMSPVERACIENMPKLKAIHTEGVGFNLVDTQAAAERGIYVCNCAGVNAGAVAEQTVLLMLAVLRDAINGHCAVCEGRQMQFKEHMMTAGGRELSDCHIGLVGLGAIGTETARRLRPFGARLSYYNRRRRSEEEEEALGIAYLPLEELAERCDIVSLHVPVTPETVKMVDDAFLRRMKKTAYLINTSRGDLVDNDALCRALTEGEIAGAGLDTISPEPVTADNPLLQLPEEARRKLVLSPHIGGITEGSFVRSHRMIWQCFTDVAEGRRPQHIVNGL